jgi:hypothetical protein
LMMQLWRPNSTWWRAIHKWSELSRNRWWGVNLRTRSLRESCPSWTLKWSSQPPKWWKTTLISSDKQMID